MQRIVFLICFFVLSFVSKAQFIEDALRYSHPALSASARSIALGHSFFALSDDANALNSNPAGLTLAPTGEIGLGVTFGQNRTNTTFLGNTNTSNNNEFYFSNVAFLFPKMSENSKMQGAITYNIENDFTFDTKYGGFNPYNSFIAQQANEGYDWTVVTGVADSNYKTFIQNNLDQDGFIREDGSMHNLSFGLGGDINDIFSLGATLSLKFGSYDYSKRYYEYDKQNLHNTYWEDDIDTLTVREQLTQDIFGITGILGMQARISEYFRLGVAIKFPTLLLDSEVFATDYTVRFDPDPENQVQVTKYPQKGEPTDYYQSYNMVMPFEFMLGVSGNILGLSYAISGSIRDASSIYFETQYDEWYNNSDILYFDDLNQLITENLGIQFTASAGLEYKIPIAPIYIRGSYTIITSPYKDAKYQDNTTIIGAGLGITLTDNFIMDLGFSYSNNNQQRANYGNESMPELFSSYNLKINPTSYVIGFRYRFDTSDTDYKVNYNNDYNY